MPPKGGKETDLSFMDRLITGTKFILTGKEPTEAFGPGQPLQPVFQEQMQGRQFDYRTGYNLTYVPRQEEPISFSQLRGLADNYDLLRLAIETCKDQVCKLEFHIVPRDENLKPDSTCKKIEDFLQYPDREHDLNTWLRMLIEDLLVIDAPTIYPRMTKGGGIYALEPMDGALIKRVIDATGRTPRAPEVAYQQYVKGMPAVDYSQDELIYRPRNLRTWKVYGFSHVEQVIMTVNIAMRRQLHQLSYYTDGNIPDLIFQVPETWNPDQIRQFQEWWDSLTTGNLGAKRQGRFVPHGVEPYDIKQAALKDEYDEWLGRIICYAFSLSPTSFVKQTNRASGEIQKEESDEQGFIPRLVWVKSLLNYIIAKYWQRPDLHCIYEREKDVDAMVQAQIDQIYLSAGVISPDEVRKKIGVEGPAPEKLLPPVLIPPAQSAEGGLAAAPSASPSQEGAKPEEGKEEEKIEKIERSKKKVSSIDRNRAAIKKAQKAIQRIFNEFFPLAADDIAEQIQKAVAKLERSEAGDEIQRILDELDLSGWAVIIDPVTGVLETIYKDGTFEAAQQIGFEASENIVNLLNKKALEYAQTRAAELVTLISDNTRDMLRASVSKAIEQGWSNQRLKQEIMDSQGFSRYRSEMIARTETAFADVAGNMQAYRESGVVHGKEWVLGSEHEDDDDCDENERAGVIGLDETFPSGDDAAPAHPNCLASGAVISAVGVSKHFKRWFEGEIVILSIPGMNDITVTPNHPILSDRGWIAAGKLKKGDYLIYCSSPRELLDILYPENDCMIGAIENMPDALLMSSAMVAVTMPTAPEDFHGDGVINGEVQVIGSASFLPDNEPPSFCNEIIEVILTLGHSRGAGLDADSAAAKVSKPLSPAPNGSMSGSSIGGPLLRGKSGISNNIGFADVSNFQSHAGKNLAECGAMTADAPGNINTGFTGKISSMDSGDVCITEAPLESIDFSCRADSKTGGDELPLDNFMCDAFPSSDVRNRLSGLIQFVQISDIKKVFFSGHVYNLQTKDNWYFAENIITHNCVCDVLPVVMDTL